MIKFGSFCAAAAILSLSACMSATMPTAPVEAAAVQAEAGSDAWWLAFDDPALEAVVASARANAFSVLQAKARLSEAQGVERGERAQFWPTLGVFGRFGIEGDDDRWNRNQTEALGLDLAWQVDVFGQIRKTVSAASERTDAGAALVRDAERLVTGDAVATYLALAGLDAELNRAAASETRLAEALSKVQRLSDAGYATDLDAVRSQAQLLDVRARRAELAAERRGLENRLTQLMASEHRAVLTPNPAMFNLSGPAPALLRALPDAEDFTQTRPDVRAAWNELSARAAEVAAAKRQLLPDVSLSASVFMGEDGRDIISPTNLTNDLVARLAMPLLGRGRLLANIDVADARLAQAELVYQETVLRALLEVDTVRAETEGLREASRQRTQALQAARTALTQSRRLFDAGEIGYLDVLVAEQALIDAERKAIATRRDYMIAWARLQAAVSPI
jgi:NodT family efflux transporter outer membrane factor (OMF) lipoprotein